MIVTHHHILVCICYFQAPVHPSLPSAALFYAWVVCTNPAVWGRVYTFFKNKISLLIKGNHAFCSASCQWYFTLGKPELMSFPLTYRPLGAVLWAPPPWSIASPLLLHSCTPAWCQNPQFALHSPSGTSSPLFSRFALLPFLQRHIPWKNGLLTRPSNKPKVGFLSQPNNVLGAEGEREPTVLVSLFISETDHRDHFFKGYVYPWRKGEEGIRNWEKREGRRRTGGRKCQAERRASAKAEVGDGLRCRHQV